jgi:hypothetical protein
MAGAAHATPSFQDSAVGSGSAGIFTDFNFNVTSGPSGENPTGFTTSDAVGDHFVTSSITCLSVNGKRRPLPARWSQIRSASPTSGSRS